MNTTVQSLKEYYVAQGGELSDVQNITTIPDMISAITELVGAGGHSGGGSGGTLILETYKKSGSYSAIEDEEIFYIVGDALNEGKIPYLVVSDGSRTMTPVDDVYVFGGWYTKQFAKRALAFYNGCADAIGIDPILYIDFSGNVSTTKPD